MDNRYSSLTTEEKTKILKDHLDGKISRNEGFRLLHVSAHSFDLIRKTFIASGIILSLNQRKDYVPRKTSLSPLGRYLILNGFKQSALAKKIGISSSAISSWSHGQTRPNAEIMPRLAHAIGKTEMELYRMFTTANKEAVATLSDTEEPAQNPIEKIALKYPDPIGKAIPHIKQTPESLTIEMPEFKICLIFKQ